MNKQLLLIGVAIGIVIGGAGGSWWGAKLAPKCPDLKCAPAPDCNCPAAVSLQSFDLDKLNNKKGNFTYSPQVSDVTIQISAADSLWLKNAIREALNRK